MKNTLLRIVALALALLTFLTACTPAPDPAPGGQNEGTTPSDTVTESGTDTPEAPKRETYEDLSANVPAYVNDDGKSATATAKGELSAPDVSLEFNGESGLFVITSPKAVELHDPTTCDACGFTEDGAYFMSTHNLGDAQVGFSVTLATPIPLSSVTGMTVTYRTDKEAINSVFRIMTHFCATMATFHNECPSLAGASEVYQTVDINITDLDALADDDGNFSVFQFYFRNKDKTDVTIRNLTVSINPEKLLVIEELEGNYFSRGEVTAAIAQAIAERFEASNVGAEITVEVDKYRQNSSKMDGSIRYTATARLNDGSTVTGEGSVTIPHVSGVWLDTTDGSFGASHDSLGQWQESFDPSGMVFLTGNSIVAKEGLSTVEYALIPEAGSYDGADVIWRAPHILEVGDKGFDTLFVNAWLDHADVLTEGERYRLLVRGVTKHNNYVLHLDIPFAYSPLDRNITDQLTAAVVSLNNAEMVCPADTADKTAFVTEQLTALLGDPSLEVRTTLLGEGVNSVTVRVTVLSHAPVTEARLPAYEADGKTFSTVYGFAGDAMASEILNFSYASFDGNIQLVSPFDGEPDVVTVSPYIHALWNAPLSEIQSGKYPFLRGENCLPVPLELTWTDSAEGSKTYTVTVSKNRDLSAAVTFTSTECRVAVPNLEMGRAYYWQVSDGTETSQVYTFTTAVYPRFFAVEGVSNFRDIGGYYTTDGKRVKQNMMFRSAALNDGTTEAKEFMVNELGIKVELDLRGSGVAAFGKEVDRKVIAMQWYSHIFSEANYEVVRQTISAFAYPENYPMNFHCAVGRDRTGTTAFLILGLLGVEEETLLREYYSSFFSQSGSCPRDEVVLHVANIEGLMNGLARYSSRNRTMQEKIEAYLLHIGVTEAEIASIRDILLED